MGIQIWIASILSKVIINSLFDVEARQFDSLKIFLNAKLKISTNEADFIFKPKTFLSFDARIVRGKNRQCVSKYSASQNTRMLETGKGYNPELVTHWNFYIFIGTETEESDEFSVLRTPLRALSGHNGVVIAADWLPGGEQVRTQILRAIHK